MNKADRISDAELEVMKILWERKQPLSTNIIYQQLKGEKGWDRSTVRTLIKRLHEKEAIIQQKRDVYCYTPSITEAEYLKAQTISFIKRLYGGSVKNLVASLVQNENLSQEDIEKLKEFIKSEGDTHE
jgi:BlaI family penicillinase repressor